MLSVMPKVWSDHIDSNILTVEIFKVEQTQEVFLKRASSRFCASNNLLCGRPQLRNDSRCYGFQFVQLFSFVGRSRSSETKKNAELKQQREREAKSRAKETPALAVSNQQRTVVSVPISEIGGITYAACPPLSHGIL